MENLKTSQLLNYVIDCLGYSEEDCKNSSKYDLIDIIEESSPGNIEACIAFNK